jgi:type II secretory pathway component PulF
MELFKVRKKLKGAAIFSILVGSVIILGSILVYFKVIPDFKIMFAHVTKDGHAQMIISNLIDIIQTFTTLILGCGIFLIWVGYCAVRYLRKEEQSEAQNKNEF